MSVPVPVPVLVSVTVPSSSTSPISSANGSTSTRDSHRKYKIEISTLCYYVHVLGWIGIRRRRRFVSDICKHQCMIYKTNAVTFMLNHPHLSSPLSSLPSRGLRGRVVKALKLLAPLRWGSNPMRDSCQLLTEGCWFTPRNNVFLQLWKLTAIYMYN